MQNILVILILVAAISYAILWIYLRIQKAQDPCDGCDGCQLKELKERAKACEKRKNQN